MHTSLLLAVIGLGLWWSWPRPLGLVLDFYGLSELPTNPPVPDKPSLVVLPFDNLSSDPEQAFFADGITEEITAALSRISGVFVIARNTAFTYKDRSVKVGDVGRELGVRYVLEGSVRTAPDRVRITAQLIEAATERPIWSQQYDRDLRDIFDLQSEIAEEILRALSVQIRETEARRVRQMETRDLSAYQAYLRARSSIREYTKRGNESAREDFQLAIRLDPGLANAYAGLGHSGLVAVALGWDTDRAAVSVQPTSIWLESGICPSRERGYT